jgi:putative transposase
MRHVHHSTSKQIVAEAPRIDGGAIATDDLTNIRQCIKAGLQMRTGLHPRTLRRLPDVLADKAAAFGIATAFTDPAYTTMACAQRGPRRSPMKPRFACDSCGRRAHRDVNAASHPARLGESAVSPGAAVNRPDVEETGNHVGLRQ